MHCLLFDYINLQFYVFQAKHLIKKRIIINDFLIMFVFLPKGTFRSFAFFSIFIKHLQRKPHTMLQTRTGGEIRWVLTIVPVAFLQFFLDF